MTTYVMRITGFANGSRCPIAGQYLKSFVHDTSDGKGYGEFVIDPREAMAFRTMRDALDFWQQRSTVMPTRKDGKPNRPLTASSIDIVSLGNAIAQDVAEAAAAEIKSPGG